MKKMLFIFLLCFLMVGFSASAQTFPVPEHIAFNSKGDYAKYNNDIVKTIDWLQKTSWAEQLDKRKKAKFFLIAWQTGNPHVSILIRSPLLNLAYNNRELLISFMGGYDKYSIQHKSDFNKDQANIAGLRAMIDKYTNDPARKKDSAMEKLVKMDKDGKLEEWAKTDFLK